MSHSVSSAISDLSRCSRSAVTGSARCSSNGFYVRRGKRLLDLGIVLIFLPVWLPICLCLIVLSALEAGGQGLYGDIRLGQGGHVFRCWKIRTLALNTVRSCAAQKPVPDARASMLGRFLRRSSLDELPQLWCVLLGHMSLVGPRPVPSSELGYYGPCRAQVLSVRPGITGLWQISGRNDVSYDQRVSLDMRYLRGLGIWQDLVILLGTLREVWRLSGR